MTHGTELDAKMAELTRSATSLIAVPTISTADYRKIPPSDLDLRKRILLDWMFAGSALRKPRTEAGLARLLNVDKQTLLTWTASPEFQRQFYERMRMTFLSRLPQIVSALCKRAEQGDVPAIRLCLEMLGMIRRGSRR
jgi:hypothetical protein